ncbi:benzoate 4-monooxygenase cytochrome P450 [Hyaloscypha variabilis]
MEPLSAVLDLPYYAILVLVFASLVIAVVRSRAAGLEQIPGPFLAKYTDALRAYMAFKYSGREVNLFMKLHQQYRDVVRIGPRSVSVLDPRAVSVIYNVKARLSKTSNVLPFKVQGVPDSLLVIQDEERLAKYRRPPYVDDIIRTLVDAIEQHVESGKAINISSWLYFWSYDVIGKVTFGIHTGYLKAGKDFNNLIKRQQQFFEYVNVVSQMPLLDHFLAKNPIWKIFPHRTFDFIRFAQTHVKQRIAKYDTSDSSRPDLLSYFIAARETYPAVVTDDQVLAYSVTNVVAGSLSTSHVLDEIVRFLVTNPAAQQRIFEEIKAAGADEFPISLDHAKLAPYLEGVIQEGYRIHSVANVLLEREVPTQGMELPSGHSLPAGTYVGINAAAMNRIEDVFGTKPDEFNPLRWLQRENETSDEFRERRLVMDRANLTFGQGSRSCVGKNIVQLEIFKVISSIATRFIVSLLSGLDGLYSDS